MKTCTRCDEPKAEAEFHRRANRPDGLHAWCKSCTNTARRLRAARLRARPPGSLPAAGEKSCSRCKLTKPAADFYRDNSAPDGLTTACRSCVSVRRRELAAARSDAELAKKRAADAAYYEANRERIKGRVAEWARANPERIGDYGRRRRARKRGVEPVATRDERAALFESYCGLCAYCHAPADTLDHIDPLFHGGADVLDNLVPACRSCNGRKHTRPLLRWLMDMAA